MGPRPAPLRHPAKSQPDSTQQDLARRAESCDPAGPSESLPSGWPHSDGRLSGDPTRWCRMRLPRPERQQ
jgi:hypothetical protein